MERYDFGRTLVELGYDLNDEDANRAFVAYQNQKNHRDPPLETV